MAAIEPDQTMEARRRMQHRAPTRRAMAALVALGLLLSSTPSATARDTLLERAEARAARILGVARSDVQRLRIDADAIGLGGRSFRTALFAAARSGRQAFVAVDVASGEVLDAAGFQRLLEAELERPGREKFSAPARAALAGGRRATLGFVLQPVDYGPAVAGVRARHPGVDWLAGRPVGPDAETVEQVRLELLREKAALVERARRPFEAAVRALGGRQSVGLDLAPLVFADVDAVAAEALAARPDVTAVRASEAFEPAMSSAGRTVQADYPHYYGWKGANINVGVVEYGGIALSPELPASARLAAKKVTTNSVGRLICGTGPVAASGHMTLVAAAAVGRGVSSYPGVAPNARFIEASAFASTTASSSDPRVLKAVECAVLAGANVVNLSLVQNNQASYGTATDTYLDEIVAEHGVFVAVAAGNHDPNQSPRDQCLAGGVVPSPGSGWNALTVGGINDGQDTSSRALTLWANDRLWWHTTRSEPAYCWREPSPEPGDSINDRVKPELVAPAVRVTSAGWSGTGTSFATPLAAGAAATLISRDAPLRQEPETVKAALLAGSLAHQTVAPGSSAPSVSYQGLGTLTAKWAHLALSRDSPTGSPDTGGYGFSVVDGTDAECAGPARMVKVPMQGHGGRRMRFAIAWNSHDDGSGVDRRWADFNLQVWKGSTLVASSNRVASNVEWVDWTAETAVYTARIQAVRWGCNVEQETFGFAWSAYAVP
jgi:hypothetical protein